MFIPHLTAHVPPVTLCLRGHLEYSCPASNILLCSIDCGINLAFSEILLSRGCSVLFADISLRPEAQNLISRYPSKDNDKEPRGVFVKTDVTSWPDIRHMFEVALLEFGDIDIICPGAGVYEPNWSSFWRPPGSPESNDDIDGGHYSLLDINLTHPIRTTQLALSYWLHPRTPAASTLPVPPKASPHNPNRIIHISSVAGQLPVFRAPLYGASKFAISGFVRCLAPLEPTTGIRVNAVAPGVVRTPLWTEHPEKIINVDQNQDVWVTPQEVAEAMLVCLESEEYIGGTVLEVGKVTRQVQVFNDPGPDLHPSKGLVTSNTERGDDIIWESLKDDTIWGTRPGR